MRRTWATTGLLAGFLALSGAALAQDALSPRTTAPSGSATSAASGRLAEQQLVAGLGAYSKLRFTEAEQHFRAAIDADPGRAPAHYYLAYTIYKIAEPRRPNDPGKQRAAEEFAKAYAIDPGFTPAWGFRGL